MHAFDLATLAGAELRIRAREAGRDASRRSTASSASSTPDMLVIADARPRAGGRRRDGRRGVGSVDATTAVVFESAYFKPASVRRTSKRLGLKTEASARFERGADINAPVVALAARDRADASRSAPAVSSGRSSIAIRGRASRSTLHLRAQRLALAARRRVPDADVVRILRGLGLGVDARRPTAGTSSRRPSASICCARSISSKKSAATTASTSSSRRSRS